MSEWVNACPTEVIQAGVIEGKDTPKIRGWLRKKTENEDKVIKTKY